MSNAGLVNITLPTGEAATVPQADLSQAVAAGAHVTTEQEDLQNQIGGPLGQLETGVIGAGRVATFGLSDAILAEGANVIGGHSLRKDVLQTLNLAREANPYSNMAGETAGLFMPGGAGEAITSAGEGVEGAVASRFQNGLVSRVAGMGARGGAEGALIGVQHEISEAELGDHQLNAEKLLAGAEKDALFGAGIGSVLGAGGYYLGKASSLIRRGPGPSAGSVLDEIAGVPGAGRALRSEASSLETLVEDVQRAGATTEQAAKMTDELQTIARAKSEAGPLSGLIDDMAGRYATRRAGGNVELEEILRKGYGDRASRLAQQEMILDTQARSLADAGTKAMRGVEDTANEVHFTERPQQMAKLVDPAKYDLARDASVRMCQDVQETLGMLDSTATKGGGDVAIKKIGRQVEEFLSEHAKSPMAWDGSAEAARDAFMRTYKLKQVVGRYSGFGKPPFMRTAAENELAAVYERLRTGLEDSSVFGKGGDATREWNESFSSMKGRRDDFGRRFAVSVDEASGVPVPELDAGKLKGMLRQLGGAESDQAVKSIEAVVDGFRNRAAAIEKYGDLSTSQVAKLKAGRAAVDDFEKTFREAKRESEIVNRLKQQQLEEQGRMFGGIHGLVADIVSKPLTTMERLGAIRSTAARIDDAMKRGFGRFFDGKGSDVVMQAPRAKDVVAKEIDELRSVAQNPAAITERVSKMVGDLATYAPKHAAAVAETAQRFVQYLAKEAPQPSVPMALLAMHKVSPRYSDQQIADYERKRAAASKPQSVIDEMRAGKINRDGIRAVQAVYPALYLEMQNTAREQILKLEAEGKLRSMPYQQQAALATLLAVPPDETWRPDFIQMLQAAKAQPTQPAPTVAPQPGGGSRRPLKLDASAFETEAQTIERKAF